MSRLRLCFLVESGTDVRLVEGLSHRFDLTVLGRAIPGGSVVSQSPRGDARVIVGPASRVRFAATAFRHLLRHRASIDRVLVQGYGLAALAGNLASRTARIPTWMLVCSPVERYYRCRRIRSVGAKPYRAWEFAALRAVTRLNALLGRGYLVLSKHLAEEVREHGTRRAVHVVPVYGVDTMVFRPATEPKEAIRERLGLPQDGTLLFFSSRVAPEKDAETLLRAVRRLRDDGRALCLLHLSGGHREFLEAARAAGVRDVIHASDAVHPHELLPAYYQASDLCVQASREEGLGFSPLEALACGVPVVAAAAGGLRETIRPGETGWTYRPGDPDDLAMAIADALDHPERAAALARAGRAMVEAEYAQQIVFDRLQEILTRP